jgi:hypothetical protein
MKIYGSQECKNIFHDYVLVPMQQAGVDTEAMLIPFTFYLGENPHKHLIPLNDNYRRPHTIIEDGIIVIPDGWSWWPDPDLRRRAMITEIRYAEHEAIHWYGYMHMTPDLWQEWSRLTGKPIELDHIEKDNYYHSPTQEEFARAFQWMILYNRPYELKRFYYSLWDQDYHEIRLKIGDAAMEVDGGIKVMDVAPFIKDGRTMVPLRFVAEVLGRQVRWVPESQEVIIN